MYKQQYTTTTLLIATVFTISLVATSFLTTPVSAAPTPEACFAFNTSTGTITNYYDHENNNPADPACSREVVIPSTIGPDDTPVTAIGDASFYSKALTALTVPDSVITIGNEAFDSNLLTSVTLGNSVIAIGDWAFSHNSLTSVTIPNSLATLNEGVFYQNSLTTVTIPDSVTTLANYAFFGNSLTSVTIPSSVTSIGNWTFQNNSLTTLTIPNSVTAIGNLAFQNNSLTTLTIHGNPTLGNQTFGFNGLDKSTLPSGLTTAQRYEYYQNNAEFVRIHATDPDFIATNQDTLYTNTTGGVTYATSGYLINPASATVTYQNSAHEELSTTQAFISNNPAIQDYGLFQFVDFTNPSTPVLDTTLTSTLYRLGDELTITPPAIDGYVTPAAFTLTLSEPTATIPVTYLTQAEIDGGTTVNPDGTVNIPVPEAPNTGLQLMTKSPLVALIVGTVASGMAVLVARKTWR